MNRLFIIRQWISSGDKKDLTLIYYIALPLLFFLLLTLLTALVQRAEARAFLPLDAIDYGVILGALSSMVDVVLPLDISPENIAHTINQMVEKIKFLQGEIQLGGGEEPPLEPPLPSLEEEGSISKKCEGSETGE